MHSVTVSAPSLNSSADDPFAAFAGAGIEIEYHHLDALVVRALVAWVEALRALNVLKDRGPAAHTYAAEQLHRRGVLALETCAARRHARVKRLELRRLDASLAVRAWR